MTKLFDNAFGAFIRMLVEAQDDVADALLGLAKPRVPDDIEPEHLEAVMEGMQQAARDEFAAGSASEIVAAAFRRHVR